MQEDDLQARKRSHLTICETDQAAFTNKTAGFEHYDFLHYAITEVDIQKVSLNRQFFGKSVAMPFLISCMTGGVTEADNINMQLAEAASELNIPLGLGSLRYALDTDRHNSALRAIRNKAGRSPIMANLGAAQLIQLAPEFSAIHAMNEVLQPDVFVIHINPVQELMQKNGEPVFTGFLSALELFVQSAGIPVMVKEVGAGISKSAAKQLLQTGVTGIDVAGAGGTSWSAVEIVRNADNKGIEFWNWGLPTAYCIKTIARLKKKHDFTLVGSGGINTALDAAKAIALGADFAGSARILFHALKQQGIEGVIATITDWSEFLIKVLYLTGCSSLDAFNRHTLIEKRDLH